MLLEDNLWFVISMIILVVKIKTCWSEMSKVDLNWHFVLDESEETNSEPDSSQKEEHKDFKEQKHSDSPKKDIFRPYCLPDPDVKPNNVRIFYNFTIVGIIVSHYG